MKHNINRQFELHRGWMVQTIPQMHKQLQQLAQFFNQKTTEFIEIINSHPGKFTNNDYGQFKELIQDIRTDALNRISEYFTNKHSSKCQLYDSEITSYTQTGQSVTQQLDQFRKELEEATIQLKKEQKRREELMDFFSQKYSQNILLKKAWKLLQDNKNQRKFAREQDRKMDELYKKNLLKKAFFPWRTLTYKQGHENTIIAQTAKDIASIHEQYQSIIEILKQKITQADEMIKIKKAAKGQFAFALSKNLLKTISNLSLQVMSLNQMSLKDGESDEGETKRFMKTVNNVIGQKLSKIREYKKEILGEQNDEGEEKGKRKKRITFV